VFIFEMPATATNTAQTTFIQTLLGFVCAGNVMCNAPQSTKSVELNQKLISYEKEEH